MAKAKAGKEKDVVRLERESVIPIMKLAYLIGISSLSIPLLLSVPFRHTIIR